MFGRVTSKIFEMSTSETNNYGSGGMFTKIKAAEIASSFGCNTIILDGNLMNPISNVKKTNVGTLFFSNVKKRKGVRSWLAGSINISGIFKPAFVG